MEKQITFLKIIALILCVPMCSGCAMVIEDQRLFVSNSIRDRVDIGLPAVSDKEGFQIPDSISLEDGLSEDEAVAIALWNNAQFQADLARLGLAKADLQEAGMIKNPVLSLFFPVGPRQMEWTLTQTLELIWQRPHRLALAKLNTDKVAQDMVQHGLLLIKDVLMSYADLILYRDRAHILQEEIKLQKEILRITESRLKAGDISENEAIAIRLAAARAEEDYLRFAGEAGTEEIRFKTLLGVVSDHNDIQLAPDNLQFYKLFSEEEILSAAYTARPDMRAAEIAIEAAGKGLDWENSKIWNFTASLDANDGLHEIAPGMQLELPLFNMNEGGRSRAVAEMDQAVKQYLATKQKITREVLEAYHNYFYSHDILTLLRTNIIPNALQASDKAEKTYLLGDISYLAFLDFKRQLLDARLREAEAAASVQKATAQLRYSVGFKPTALE